MAGIGGSGVMTLGAGVIADLFPPEKRGLATALWSLGSLLGPLIGPVCGGFISESIGWRWVFWILTMVSGTVAAGIEIVNRETYAPVLLQRKTERLAKELGRDDLHSALVKKEEIGLRPSFRRNLRVGLRRPFLLYFKSPIVFLLSTYVAFQYGLLYLFFTSMPAVFRGIYGFSVGMSGVAYIGIGVGFGLGMLLSALTNDRMMISMARRNGGKMEPEMRLPLMILSAAASPISFVWYGWAVQTEAHWIVPIIGTVPFAFGLNGIYLTSQNYVIDSYLEYAASANATLVVTRSILGTVLPLAGPKLFESLDYGWGNTLLGFISLAFVPVPIIFTKYGKYLREKYVVNL
jgi:MFS family permease